MRLFRRRRPLLRLATFLIRRATRGFDALTHGVHFIDDVIKRRTRAAKTTMLDGSPVTDDHWEIQPSGMQKGYVVLTEAERAKGYVAEVRAAYIHDACGKVTTMTVAIAETYAREPTFYSETFCASCRTHYPVAEFKWCGTDQRVGS